MSLLATLLAASLPVVAGTESDGLKISATVAGTEGERAVEIRFADAGTGTPLLEADPLAWLYPDDPQASCATILARAQNGSLSSPAISLNSLRVVVAFADGSLAVLDPQVTFGGTQLESALDLGTNLRDMVAAPDGNSLLALPVGPGPGLLVKTRERLAVVARIALEDDAVAAMDGKGFWVFDSAGLRPAEAPGGAASAPITWPVRGAPRLFASRGGDLLVGSAGGPVGIRRAGAARVVPVGEVAGLRSGAWLSQATLWALATGDGELVLAAGGRPPKTVEGIADALAVASDRTGRFALVIDRGGWELSLVDTANGAVVHRQAQTQRLDRITTSSDFAYVHSADSPTVQLVSFEVVNQSQRISQVELPFGEAGQTGGAAFSRVAVMPGGATVVGSDGRSIYVYAEGMMVPMGTLSGVSRAIVGQAVLDRSLREVDSGLFRTLAGVPYGGRYRLPVRLGSPKVDSCLTIDLPGPPRPAGPPARLAEFLNLPPGTRPGSPVPLAIRTNLAVANLVAIATDATGTWQRHVTLHRAADGMLRGAVEFPRPGYYHLVAGPARAAIAVSSPPGEGT